MADLRPIVQLSFHFKSQFHFPILHLFSISCCTTRPEATTILVDMLQCFLNYITKLRGKGLLRIHPSNRHLCTHLSGLAPADYTPLMFIYILFVPTTYNQV